MYDGTEAPFRHHGTFSTVGTVLGPTIEFDMFKDLCKALWLSVNH